MKVKLRKIGNSWGVIFPKEVVEPFLKLGFKNTYIETGEILLHEEKKSAEIPEAPEATDPLGIKKSFSPPAVYGACSPESEGGALAFGMPREETQEEEELTVVSEEEIPEEYILKPGYGATKNKRNGAS